MTSGYVALFTMATLLVLTIKIPGGDAQTDRCSQAGYFVNSEYGHFHRCIFNGKINRWLLFKVKCRLEGGIQQIFDPSQRRCIVGPPTTTTMGTTTTPGGSTMTTTTGGTTMTTTAMTTTTTTMP